MLIETTQVAALRGQNREAIVSGGWSRSSYEVSVMGMEQMTTVDSWIHAYCVDNQITYSTLLILSL